MGLAGRDQIKDEMTSRIKIFPDAPERGLQSDVFKYVIERIEVGGDQIDRRGQTQTTNVLLQQTNILTGAITRRHREHLRANGPPQKPERTSIDLSNKRKVLSRNRYQRRWQIEYRSA